MVDARTVLITGCSRGLGKALVEGFIGRGHRLAGCARSSGAMKGLRERYGDQHLFSAVDLADDDSVAAFCKEAVEKLGAPDLVINNGAIINHNAPLWQISEQEFAEVMDINVNGTTRVIRHIVPEMINRGRGVIVNLSSGWGRSTSPDVAPYCASKWAIEGLTAALSQELPSGLAAVALNPGIINTDMLQSCFGESASGYRTPEEWAATAVPFLEALGPDDNGSKLTAP